MNGTLVKKLGEYFLYMPYDSIYGPERTSASRLFKVTMSTDTENVLVATTSEEDEYIELAKLSMENCDEVASGYNLDDLANKHIKEWDYENTLGKGQSLLAHDNFIMGFQKALELMENELKQLREFARDCAKNWDCDSDGHKYNTGCRCCEAETLLQQTEWDVEIEWEDEIGGKPTPFQKRTIIRELDNGEEIEWTCFWDNGWWGTDGVRCPNVISWERMPILDRKNRLILNKLEEK